MFSTVRKGPYHFRISVTDFQCHHVTQHQHPLLELYCISIIGKSRNIRQFCLINALRGCGILQIIIQFEPCIKRGIQSFLTCLFRTHPFVAAVCRTHQCSSVPGSLHDIGPRRIRKFAVPQRRSGIEEYPCLQRLGNDGSDTSTFRRITGNGKLGAIDNFRIELVDNPVHSACARPFHPVSCSCQNNGLPPVSDRNRQARSHDNRQGGSSLPLSIGTSALRYIPAHVPVHEGRDSTG